MDPMESSSQKSPQQISGHPSSFLRSATAAQPVSGVPVDESAQEEVLASAPQRSLVSVTQQEPGTTIDTRSHNEARSTGYSGALATANDAKSGPTWEVHNSVENKTLAVLERDAFACTQQPPTSTDSDFWTRAVEAVGGGFDASAGSSDASASNQSKSEHETAVFSLDKDEIRASELGRQDDMASKEYRASREDPMDADPKLGQDSGLRNSERPEEKLSKTPGKNKLASDLAIVLAKSQGHEENDGPSTDEAAFATSVANDGISGAGQDASLVQPQTASEGGIYDDADDDVQLKLPTFSGKDQQGATEHKDSTSFSTGKRQAIRDIVTGTRSPKKSKHEDQKTSKNAAASNVKSQGSEKSMQQKSEIKGKRKRPIEPAKKVLKGKKETQLATTLLKGKQDLAQFLPEEDCFFLADNFWIFTVEQLSFALKPDSRTSNDPDSPFILYQIAAQLATDSVSAMVQEKKPGDSGKSGPPETVANGSLASSSHASSASKSQQVINNSRTNCAQESTGRARDQPSDQNVESSTKNNGVGADTNASTSATENSAMVKQSLGILQQTETACSGGQADSRSSSNENCTGLHEKDDDQVSNSRTGDNDLPTASATPSEVDSAKISSSVVSPKEKAREQIQSWKEAIRAAESSVETPVASNFMLDGAIRLLFPVSTLNFLKSIKIYTLWSFLCLKKTETGAICRLMSLWRKQCDLSKVPDAGLAKHFLGVAFRVESALTAIPPVSKENRAWMDDPMVTMTGAARDFLVSERKIVSASEFIGIRTGDLADSLVEWRQRKGMEPLKGSGKVAMISSWKALAREALEAEAGDGRIVELNIDSVDNAVVEEEEKQGSVPKKQAKKKRKKKAGNSVGVSPAVQNASRSKHFVQNVLGAETAKLLRAAGITTASQFFDYDASPDSSLFVECIKAERADGVSSFNRTIDQWRQRLRKELDQLRRTGSTVVPTLQSVSGPTAAGRKNPPTVAEIKPASYYRLPDGMEDPFESLSSVTKKFLRSTGKKNAYEFLSSRTTDMARDFKKWRMAEGMPELKGLGTIASVSSWKAIVRKTAIDAGLRDLAELDPPKSFGKRTNQRVIQGDPQADSLSEDRGVSEMASRSKGLLADERRVIAVQGKESPGKFVFELSIRQKGQNKGLFVTYKGLWPSAEIAGTDGDATVQLVMLKPAAMTVKQHVRILKDVPFGVPMPRNVAVSKEREFSLSNSGGGLIEISQYDAYPFKNQDLSPLQSLINHFVTQDLSSFIWNCDVIDSSEFNILLRQTEFDSFQYLLYLPNAIEKGQTVPVDFPSITDIIGSGKCSLTSEVAAMQKISELSRLLSLSDLRSLLAWLRGTLLSSARTKSATAEPSASSLPFKKLCVRRRRIAWVARCLSASIGSIRISSDDNDFIKSLEFGRRTKTHSEWREFSPEQKVDFEDALRQHIELEIRCATEQDVCCGIGPRKRWCRRARNLFDSLVEALARVYFLDSKDEQRVAIEAVLRKYMIFDEDWANSGSLDDFIFQGFAALTSKQGYIEAMELCGEVPFEVGAQFVEDAVACLNAPVTVDSEATVIRRKDDVRGGRAHLSEPWYRELFWQIFSTSVSAFHRNLFGDENADFDVNDIRSTCRALVIGSAAVKGPKPLRYSDEVHVTPYRGRYFPNALEFFLGIAWPVLRRSGWSLIAGQTPDDLLFLSKTRKKGTSKSEADIREQKRLCIETAVNGIGFGVIPKNKKRLLVAAVMDRAAGEQTEADTTEQSLISVDTVISRYREKFTSKLPSDNPAVDQTPVDKLDQILSRLEDCFGIFAPLFEPAEVSGESTEKCMARYSVKHFVRFLLALPSVLKHTTVSEQDKNDTLGIAKDLLDFVVANQDTFFEKKCLPSIEEYEDCPEETRHDLLESKLGFGDSVDQKRGDMIADTEETYSVELTEALLEEDKPSVTDFIVAVMEQAVPFRATEEDVKKKGGRILLGFPGVVCRHCRGLNFEGRYFFSSIESLSTCYTVLEKHLLKCSATPSEVKTKLALARSKHADQRKNLATGAQQAYFNRLWSRLRNSKLVGHTASDVRVNMCKVPSAKGRAEEKTVRVKEFADHRDLLDYLRGERKSKELQEAIEQYYSCLEYAGRVYMTDSAPNHFSSAWLLAKILPRKDRTGRINIG